MIVSRNVKEWFETVGVFVFLIGHRIVTVYLKLKFFSRNVTVNSHLVPTEPFSV